MEYTLPRQPTSSVRQHLRLAMLPVCLAYCLTASIALAGSAIEEPLASQAEPVADNPAADDANFRVVGGIPAHTGQWPSMVAIMTKGGDGSYRIFCGGTVVGREWVLTAAHCALYMKEHAKTINFVVREGSQNLAANDGHFISISDVVVFPGYQPDRVVKDVALLRLAKRASSPRQKLVGETEIPEMLAPGKMATVTGFGNTTWQGKTSSQLLQVDIPIMNPEKCTENAGSSVDASAFCAGTAGVAKDSCQGDSGGPLFVRQVVGQALQVGVVSKGQKCGLTYGIYTSVGKFESWIRSQVPDADFADEAPIVASGPGQSGLGSLVSTTGEGVAPSQLAQITLDIAEGSDLKLGSDAEIRVTSSIAGAVVIFNQNPDGRVYQIYPSKVFPSAGSNPNFAQVKAGEVITIPSAKQHDDGYRFVVQPPEGVNKLIAFVLPSSDTVQTIIQKNSDGEKIENFGDLLARLSEAESQSRGLEPARVQPVNRAFAEKTYAIVR